MSLKFITFTTPGPYEEDAERMKRSAARVGIEVVHYHEPPMESWDDAVLHKQVVIRRAFREHPRHDICWIDADAIVHSHPTLLFQLPSQRHVAAHLDSNKWCWTGTLWMRNSRQSLEILDLWDRENKENPGVIKDNNLYPVLFKEGRKPWFHNLPPAYCWVSRHWRRRYPGAVPVIEHLCRGGKLQDEVVPREWGPSPDQ